MIETWFTSDTHFGHKNILEYEKEARPFSTVEEMNEVLISNWNGSVKPSDIIWHLGDFCFGRANLAIADRLQGKKRLVMGNHDTHPSAEFLRYFDRLFGVTFWKKCILSHVPVHPSNLGSRAFLNVHGHLHSKKVQREVFIANEYCDHGETRTIDDRNYYNVSCEQNNLTPINADIILQRLKELE